MASAAMHAVDSLAREMRHAYQAAAYEHGEPGIEVFLDIDGAVHLPGVHGTRSHSPPPTAMRSPPRLCWGGPAGAPPGSCGCWSLLSPLDYPVTLLTTFTHYQTKLAVIPFLFLGIGLLLFLSSALHRSLWNKVVTPLRLTVVAAASALAGALAWLATGTLLMGLLSGFSVCAMAPIWLSLARVRGLDTATRRWFTNLAAAWFGTALATPHEPG